jgi:hypothetical protein
VGHSIVQVVNRCLHTAGGCIISPVIPCGICDAESDSVTSLYPSNSVTAISKIVALILIDIKYLVIYHQGMDDTLSRCPVRRDILLLSAYQETVKEIRSTEDVVLCASGWMYCG